MHPCTRSRIAGTTDETPAALAGCRGLAVRSGRFRSRTGSRRLRCGRVRRGVSRRVVRRSSLGSMYVQGLPVLRVPARKGPSACRRSVSPTGPVTSAPHGAPSCRSDRRDAPAGAATSRSSSLPRHPGGSRAPAPTPRGVSTRSRSPAGSRLRSHRPLRGVSPASGSRPATSSRVLRPVPRRPILGVFRSSLGPTRRTVRTVTGRCPGVQGRYPQVTGKSQVVHRSSPWWSPGVSRCARTRWRQRTRPPAPTGA